MSIIIKWWKRIIFILVVMILIIHIYEVNKSLEFYPKQRDIIRMIKDPETRPKKIKVIRNLLTIEQCKSIIKEAEHRCKCAHGWYTKRHKKYPTTDIRVHPGWDNADYVFKKVYREIIPQYKIFHPKFNTDLLHIEELFVVKYNPSEQKSLEKHQDGSMFSFIIALNKEFKGGGTKFADKQLQSLNNYKLQTGDCIIFSGWNFHEGLVVTEGTRYILTGFITGAWFCKILECSCSEQAREQYKIKDKKILKIN